MTVKQPREQAGIGLSCTIPVTLSWIDYGVVTGGAA